ncbi:MAG: hypothetical protein ACR2IE_12845 [Candidatus Sumerlaeaceae bacterium]
MVRIRKAVLPGTLVMLSACCGAQMSEIDSTGQGPSSVRSFDSTTTRTDRRPSVHNDAATATLKGGSLLDKSPARLTAPAKPGTGGYAAKSGAPAETRVLETGIDAREFLQIIGPTLGKNLTAKQIDSAHVAVTGTSESLRRTVQLTEQIRSAMKRPVKQIQLHAALLTDHAPDDTTTATPIALAQLPANLPNMGLAANDLESAAMPGRLWKIADLTAPATGGGENTVQFSERMTLLYELRQTLTGDYEVALNLAEKDKGANPFDLSVGRTVFANHFRTDTMRPVVLGITTPSRSLMLIFRLRNL